MKSFHRVLVAAGIAAAMGLTPSVGGAYWGGPFAGPYGPPFAGPYGGPYHGPWAGRHPYVASELYEDWPFPPSITDIRRADRRAFYRAIGAPLGYEGWDPIGPSPTDVRRAWRRSFWNAWGPGWAWAPPPAAPPVLIVPQTSEGE